MVTWISAQALHQKVAGQVPSKLSPVSAKLAPREIFKLVLETRLVEKLEVLQ